MAVKRIFKNRLEKASVAGESESVSNGYLERLIRARIHVGITPPNDALEGSIWRNPSTNPDTWSMLMGGLWVNMLVTSTEHGLMSDTDYVKLLNSTSVPTNSRLVEYDTVSDINAKSFNSISSRRFKTNISKIDEATELIKDLEGVNFKWKLTGESDIGLIAEDVFEVLPEVVKIKDGVIEGIAYDHLVAVLIEGFKEQQEKIDKILNHLGLDNE